MTHLRYLRRARAADSYLKRIRNGAKRGSGMKRTVVTMLLAAPDQGRTVYGVYHADVRLRSRGWSWDVHRAVQVGTVEVRGGAQPSYRAMAEPYSTKECPVWERM